ncbi:MAG: class I SAM-dependent RNA methyltransferase [Proteobacteria bacterium]|nr:class I SAM-dependent RNA methyltransferase [Pseudomonadota bacterium]
MARETTLNITAMGRHGEGVAEGPRGPVYVPFALPGETVRAAIEGKRGRLLEVLEPSPERADPPCPHFGRCGGCVLQHWREGPYRDWKRGLVETALRHRHVEATVADVIDAHGAGRRRVTLHVLFARGGVLAGFMEGRSHRLLDLDRCPILAPELADASAIARELGTAVRGHAKSFDILITASDTGLDCDLRGRIPDHPDIQMDLSEAAERLDLARVTINGDLGLERRTPMLAADDNEPALKALGRAARATPGLKPVTTELRDLFRRPLTARELDRYDVVVFDPPRAGAESQARELAQSKAPMAIAVSCDPATLARDLSILVEGGYRIESITLVDQFKYAAHVETVAVLRRG